MTHSKTKTFSFAERAKLNEDMQALQEGPYVGLKPCVLEGTEGDFKKFWYNVKTRKWADFKKLPEMGDGPLVHDWDVIANPENYGLSKKDVAPYKKNVTRGRGAQYEIPEISKMVAPRGWVRIVLTKSNKWLHVRGLDKESGRQAAVAVDNKFPEEFDNITLETVAGPGAGVHYDIAGGAVRRFLKTGNISTLAGFRDEFDPTVVQVIEAERPEAVSRFVEKHKKDFIKQYGDKKKGTSVAFGVAWKQYKAGHLEHVELPEELAAIETSLLNSFADESKSNESCGAKARRIMDFVAETSRKIGIKS